MRLVPQKPREPADFESNLLRNLYGCVSRGGRLASPVLPVFHRRISLRGLSARLPIELQSTSHAGLRFRNHQ